MHLAVIPSPYRSATFCVKITWTDCNQVTQIVYYDFTSRDAAVAAMAKAKRKCAPGCLGMIGYIAQMSDCALDSVAQVKLDSQN